MSGGSGRRNLFVSFRFFWAMFFSACVVKPLFIVSLLATLAFKLCAVDDTGMKTGWVRCRHGAGWGAGRGRGGYVLR